MIDDFVTWRHYRVQFIAVFSVVNMPVVLLSIVLFPVVLLSLVLLSVVILFGFLD